MFELGRYRAMSTSVDFLRSSVGKKKVSAALPCSALHTFQCSALLFHTFQVEFLNRSGVIILSRGFSTLSQKIKFLVPWEGPGWLFHVVQMAKSCILGILYFQVLLRK